ncbi:type II toxin-antitoxin system RelE/ParE family toxin [Microvirga sp. W0021]|uniref:Toxin n=1 Tax=Hohaiivirga grylli TaxID=3133970 RepID=A0ABV0BQD5_9HYPH
MSSNKVSGYRLTPAAYDDLDDIWRYTAETWSLEQADKYIDELSDVFETIASLPSLARERMEFNPPVRIHVHQSHLVIYRISDNFVDILRLLGGRQDWISVLKAADL